MAQCTADLSAHWSLLAICARVVHDPVARSVAMLDELLPPPTPPPPDNDQDLDYHRGVCLC